MRPHQCTGDEDTCRVCADAIAADVDARAGYPRGYSQRDLDAMADGAAADMVYGRGL